MEIVPLRKTVYAGGAKVALENQTARILYPSGEIADRPHRHPPLGPKQACGCHRVEIEGIEPRDSEVGTQINMLQYAPGVQSMEV